MKNEENIEIGKHNVKQGKQGKHDNRKTQRKI